MTNPRRLTTKEVAALKGVTVKTVNVWAQTGLLPVAEVVPIVNARLFDADVVDAFQAPASRSDHAPSEDASGPSEGASSISADA